MASTAWLYPTTTGVNTGYGSYGWNNPSNIVSDNGSFAGGQGVYGFSVSIRTGSIRLFKGGGTGITGTDLASTNTSAFVKYTDSDLTFGSSSQLWGTTLTAADVNDASFGFVWADNQGSNYLYGAGFSASVPGSAVITGVEAVVNGQQNDNGFSYSFSLVDSFAIRIHYSTDQTISGGGSSTGGVFQEYDESTTRNDKMYQFKAYDEGTFLTEWRDVTNEPEFKLQINTLGTSMPINLGRNLDNFEPVPEQLLDESSDDFLTEDGDTLIGYSGTSNSIGTGSDADVNYDINVNAYYGGYDYLITQDGEELVTQDYEMLYVVDGAPEGRSLITGFVSKWRTGYGNDEAVNQTMLTYGWELNQTILETTATTPIDLTASTGSFGLAAPDGVASTYHTLVQTFTAPSTGKLSGVTLYLSRGISDGVVNKIGGTGGAVTVTFYAGATATGTPLGSVTVTVPNWTNTNNPSTVEPYRFDLADYISLTNGSTYNFKVTVGRAKSFDYPIYVQNATAYSGGAATHTNDSGSTTSGDVRFAATYASGITTVPFASADPSTVMRYIVDFAASKGCHIQYTDDSIDDTGTVVTYQFNTNTCGEAINKVLELAPSDWYYYIDPSDNTLYFKARPETPDHTFTLERDIAEFSIERDMENIVNETYFSGGGDPALFVKNIDQISQDDWRRGLAKLSDNRVTDATSANTISLGHIERYSEPVYKSKLVVASAVYDIETISPGQLVAFRGFGNFIDELELQISEVQYNRDTVTLTLGTLRPAVPKRLEDLRRNLDVIEQQNNPTIPS